MVSDIVLSQELPEFIRDSVDAYAGCISGAMTKDEYVKTIAGTGFREVGIVNETSIPVEEWFNDTVAESITKKFKVSSEQIKEVLQSVISITVRAVK